MVGIGCQSLCTSLYFSSFQGKGRRFLSERDFASVSSLDPVGSELAFINKTSSSQASYTRGNFSGPDVWSGALLQLFRLPEACKALSLIVHSDCFLESREEERRESQSERSNYPLVPVCLKLLLWFWTVFQLLPHKSPVFSGRDTGFLSRECLQNRGRGKPRFTTAPMARIGNSSSGLCFDRTC